MPAPTRRTLTPRSPQTRRLDSCAAADENFPLPVIHVLRALGYDVHTLRDYGQSGQALPDPEVLALATAQQRALLTLNRRDFIRLHLQNADHAGIIVCTFDADFVGQA